MGLHVYEENCAPPAEKMVLPSAEDVKKRKTDELISFLKEWNSKRNLELLPEDFDVIEKNRINGLDFLEMTKQDFKDIGMILGPASRLALLVKEIRLGQQDENDENDELPNIGNLVLSDQEDEFSYEIPPSWTTAKAKLKDLCSAKIIRVNDLLLIDKKYNSVPVMAGCKVTSVDQGKLSVICFITAHSDYENHCEILLQGNMEKEDLPSFGDYMGEFGEDDLEGKEFNDISSLPELEKIILSTWEVPQEHWPKTFNHSYRDITIIRDAEYASIECAIEMYRLKRKNLQNKK